MGKRRAGEDQASQRTVSSKTPRLRALKAVTPARGGGGPSAGDGYRGPADPSLSDWAAAVVEGGVAALRKEYMELRKEMLGTPKTPLTTEAFKSNVLKNRYQDVPCWDQTRVVLKARRPIHDYIHANFVHGLRRPRQFIATQGPMEDLPGVFESTLADFWLMVWQQKVLTIVMLCATVESGKAKCAQYWPEWKGERLDCGPVHIRCLHVSRECFRDDEASLSVRVTTLELALDGQARPRRLTHWLNDSWPDRACPPSAYPVARFVSHSHHQNKRAAAHNGFQEQQCPVVVHCSAGIGRSGTFIAIHIALTMANDFRTLNVAQIVRHLRTQRAFAVQTPVQYFCIYLALLTFLHKQRRIPFNADKLTQEIANVK